MKKYFFLIFSFLLFQSITQAQNKILTIEDVVFNSYSSLAPSNLRQLSWIPNSNDYVYLVTEGQSQQIVKFSAENDNSEVMLSLEGLNQKLKESGLNEVKSFPYFYWIDNKTLSFTQDNFLLNYDVKKKSLTKIINYPKKANNTTNAPNNKFIAYTVGNNLFVSLDIDQTTQITLDDESGIINGQSVHRNEFGINGGIFWSPNSNYIAFYRMDETMVTDYPILDISTTPATYKLIKYPMAGQTSHHVTIGIYDIKNQKTNFLKTGEPLEQYLTCVTWEPSEKYIYVAHLNRDQNHMQLTKYDAETGEKIKMLFEEKDEEFVEPEHDLIFLPNDENQFLWFSERDGYQHLYLYDTDGKLIKQITKGEWVVKSFDGFDKKGENILISATKDGVLENHYYIINIESGEITKISNGVGIHRINANSDFNYFIDSYSSLEIPREINIVDAKGKIIKNIHKSENPLKDFKIGKTEISSLFTDDGIELYTQTIYPPDFDKTKKYPVIVYVYGGPHSQQVNNSWPVGRYDFWFHLMAQNGYIIFQLDNRGEDNRGSAFEQATFRKLGTIEIADQMKGVEYLKSLEYIDKDRFGVYGWSYGGFMTTSLMLRTDGAFKVGVGGGAVIDWKYYEVMYTERYMDTPETNPDGYDEANLLNYVENLNGKLLLVHGTDDGTVVWQQTLSFVQKATNLNKQLDYYPYIGHEHGVRGQDALNLYTKITNYFLENL
ncbi:MAG: DPP IV N-terminal domain-containing protein [Ignavibacteriales bacterium]|nr:DPP IV N-terminal domain-containing protein [Ignavibacteriales bacterium]